jgi:two-component system sensor histidine kinase DesK
LKTRALALHRRLVPPEIGMGFTPYLWLVYLSFFFLEWFFRPFAAWEPPAVALTTAVFLVLYFSAYRRRGGAALLHIVGIAALGVAWAGASAGASVFFIYAASFAFLVGPPRVSTWVVVGIVAVAAVTAVITEPMLFYWLPGVFISAVIGAANIFFGEQQRRNAELRLSQAEVRRLARVAERERIARDLHDVLGHTLSLISVKSELAGRLIERDPRRAADELASIHESARGALAEVREAIGGFREQGLDEALDHARSSLRAADIEPEIEHDRSVAIGRDREAMLALVIREAVTNILRHADARRCRIRLVADGGGTELTISDDGRGRIRHEGSGVQGMRARLESLGGTFEIGEDGKTLRACVPENAA